MHKCLTDNFKLRLILFSLHLFLFAFYHIANASHPPDPASDIDWNYSLQDSLHEIEEQFNRARIIEGNQSGSTLPQLKLPPRNIWNLMSDDKKALWLINRERKARGLIQLSGIEKNVNEIAQYYAEYLMKTDSFDHIADGRSPLERLDSKLEIASCRDFLRVSENIAVFWSGSTFPLEQAVYMWLYADSGSNWGHRHTILWSLFNDNSGSVGSEGFLGIGRATGQHRGWPEAEIVVMNVFDPCQNWKEYR